MSKIDSKTDTKTVDATHAFGGGNPANGSNASTQGGGNAGSSTASSFPNPFASMFGSQPSFNVPGSELFASFVRDQLGRMQAWSDEMARMEVAMFDRLRQNAGDASRVLNDSIGYLSTVTAEWRKLALDAGRRAADLTSVRS